MPQQPMAIAPAATKIGFSLRAAHLTATSVSNFSPPCGQLLPTHGVGETPGSARGYRSHPGGVKRQRSISLSTLDTPCDPGAAFLHEIRAPPAQGGSPQVDPCAHVNAGGQQLGAIRAQNYRTRALCHLNGATRYPVQAIVGRRERFGCKPRAILIDRSPRPSASAAPPAYLWMICGLVLRRVA